MEQIAFRNNNQKTLAKRHIIIAALAKLVDADSLITDAAQRKAFETDAFSAYRRVPLAVVLPKTTEQVSAILKFCNANDVPIVARGSGTSLCGGAIPQEDAVVLGITKLKKILDTDFTNRSMRVEAGITNLAISDAVAAEGFFYAPDPSSQIACTIAGNIAMNSGGAHCLKYGVTTNNVLGVKMVLMDGTIVEIGGECMDSAGYDLLGIVVGSEGQLGIVTEAVVRILPIAEDARPVLLGFESSGDAGATVAAIIGAGIVPVAIEYMDRQSVAICEAYAHAGYPTDAEAVLVVEVEGAEFEMEEELARIVEIAEQHNLKTYRRSRSTLDSAAIWKGRKSAFGAIGRIADSLCMDGTIPTSQLPLVLERIEEIVTGYGLRAANVFHAGDGNMHPLILYDINTPGDQKKAENAGSDILRLCVEVGGCLTGEHGVGIEKRELMGLQFSKIDLEQQMRVRAVFDPQWLLNPSKVFPLSGRWMPNTQKEPVRVT